VASNIDDIISKFFLDISSYDSSCSFMFAVSFYSVYIFKV